MENKDSNGWKKLLTGYPWLNVVDSYPLTAYSEYMPPPKIGRKPLGRVDYGLFPENDPYGWLITEMEEEYELKPGIECIGRRVMSALMKLGKGLTEHYIHGHGGLNLKDNPYWPSELALRAGTLAHERYVALLPLMLSRTQDDKGRILWTLFGNSIHDPDKTLWKSFYTSPGTEIPVHESVVFFTRLLSDAYNEKLSDEASLHSAGFRILPSDKDSTLPQWTRDGGTRVMFCNSMFLRYLSILRLPEVNTVSFLDCRDNALPWSMSNVIECRRSAFLALTNSRPGRGGGVS